MYKGEFSSIQVISGYSGKSDKLGKSAESVYLKTLGKSVILGYSDKSDKSGKSGKSGKSCKSNKLGNSGCPLKSG